MTVCHLARKGRTIGCHWPIHVAPSLHSTIEWLAEGTAKLSELQEKLYAQNQWAVLVIFQAMDAAGKDGAIKHVMSGVNAQWGDRAQVLPAPLQTGAAAQAALLINKV